jgi:hypothetical protein
MRADKVGPQGLQQRDDHDRDRRRGDGAAHHDPGEHADHEGERCPVRPSPLRHQPSDDDNRRVLTVIAYLGR